MIDQKIAEVIGGAIGADAAVKLYDNGYQFGVMSSLSTCDVLRHESCDKCFFAG